MCGVTVTEWMSAYTAAKQECHILWHSCATASAMIGDKWEDSIKRWTNSSWSVYTNRACIQGMKWRMKPTFIVVVAPDLFECWLLKYVSTFFGEKSVIVPLKNEGNILVLFYFISSRRWNFSRCFSRLQQYGFK